MQSKLSPGIIKQALEKKSQEIISYSSKKNNILVIFLLHIILFIYIYLPTFRGYEKFTTVIFPIFIIGLAFCMYNKTFQKSLKIRVLTIFSFGLFTIIFYSGILDIWLFRSNRVPIGSLLFLDFIRIYIDLFLTSISIYLLFKFSGKSSPEDIIQSFFIISLVQFLFCLVMLLNPELRDFVNLTLLKTSDKIAGEEIIGRLYNLRGFGIASGHLFSFPLFQGLIICAALWFVIKKSPYYSIFALTALLPIVLNARIGFIGVPVFFVSYLFITRQKLTFLLNFLAKNLINLFIVAISLIFIFSQVQQLIPENTLLWVSDGISQIVTLLTFANTENAVTLNTLSSNHLILPQHLESLLFGEGLYVFGYSSSDVHSDIGYIRFIFFGGLIYSFLVYFVFIFLYYQSIIRAQTNTVKGILLCGLLMMFIAHYKGSVFDSTNVFLRAMILLCVSTIVNYYQTKHFDNKSQIVLKR